MIEQLTNQQYFLLYRVILCVDLGHLKELTCLNGPNIQRSLTRLYKKLNCPMCVRNKMLWVKQNYYITNTHTIRKVTYDTLHTQD